VWVTAQLRHHSVGFTLWTYAHPPLSDRGGHADRIDSATKVQPAPIRPPPIRPLGMDFARKLQ
jgi:hypothetical protein